MYSKERQWELQQRAAQLTQLDMSMKDRSADWDQRLSRLETALKNSRFESEQRSHQVKQLEEQVSCMMNALKEKSCQVVILLSKSLIRITKSQQDFFY